MLQLLDDFATKLIQNEHYAHDDIASRRDQVFLSLVFLIFPGIFLVLHTLNNYIHFESLC